MQRSCCKLFIVVCGPMRSTTFSGKRYFDTFTDEYSHFTIVFLLRNKSEADDKFAPYIAFSGTQTGKVVKAICCCNAGKYTSGKTTKFCKRRGIEQKFTLLYTPQVNRAAERINRTLMECAKCII